MSPSVHLASTLESPLQRTRAALEDCGGRLVTRGLCQATAVRRGVHTDDRATRHHLRDAGVLSSVWVCSCVYCSVCASVCLLRALLFECVDTRVLVCPCVLVRACACMCTFLCVRACAFLCLCLCLRIRVCACVCACMYMCELL